jgi:hypothetical protein
MGLVRLRQGNSHPCFPVSCLSEAVIFILGHTELRRPENLLSLIHTDATGQLFIFLD